MSYFLKKTIKSKGQYLQIYEALYDKKNKRNYNKSFETIGYVNDLISKGIKDPIDHYQNKVNRLNNEAKEKLKEKKIKLIGETQPKNIGYFLVKRLWNKLNLNNDLKLLNSTFHHDFDLSNFIEGLVYSRILLPCSKYKTYNEVLPTLFEPYNFSLNQLYSGLNYIGENYQNMIEILNRYINKKFGRETEKLYFDCTNYFFEIDFEKDDKQKGPSKENRTSPIIGQALLLDSEGIPLAMKMYPGNESEQPKIREIIKELKNRHNITGRTIQVADKGLNSSNNIFQATLEGDGYIFSQSVYKLNEKERQWILDQKGYTELNSSKIGTPILIKSKIDFYKINVKKNGVTCDLDVEQKRVAIYSPSLAKKKIFEIEKLVEKAKKYRLSEAKKNEYGECGKYVNFTNENGEKVLPEINMEKIKQDKELAGFNMLVTSEINMSEEEIYFTYHNLWRIEESFKLLKSQLKSRPVYLQNKETIYGHFLICYFALTLLRILQFHIFKFKYTSNEIIEFIRNINIFDLGDSYLNLTEKSEMIFELSEKYKIPINHQYLFNSEIQKLFVSKKLSD